MFCILLAYFIRNNFRNITEAIYISLFFMFSVMLAAYVDGGQDRDETIVQFSLFMGLLLAHTLGLPALFERDEASGALDQWRILPVRFETVIAAKLAGHWLAVSMPLLIITPLLAIMITPAAAISWTLAAAFASLSMVAIGALAAALIIGQRARSGLLLMVILPLNLPVMLFGMLALSRDPAAAADAWACLIGLGAIAIPLALIACIRLLRYAN